MWDGKVGSQPNWPRVYDSPSVWRYARSKYKASRPILGLCSSRTDHFMLSADYDKVPAKYNIDLTDQQAVTRFWDELYLEFLSFYGDYAKIARSYSDKLKIFIPFVLPEGFLLEWLSRPSKEKILKAFLHPSHHWFDTTIAGMDVAYLNCNTIKLLSKIKYLPPTRLYVEEKQSELYQDVPYSLGLPESVFLHRDDRTSNPSDLDDVKHNDIWFTMCKVTETVLDNHLSNEQYEVNRVIGPELFRYDEEDLPKALTKSKIIDLKGGEELLRRLIRAKNLTNETGFGLPTDKLSNECGVSRPQISKLLSILSEEGNLVCVDEKFAWGSKARTFRASGDLRKEIVLYFEKPKEPRPDYTLPTFIPDGQWERSLFTLAVHFIKESVGGKNDYKQYCLALPGIELKDRKQKVERIVKKWDDIK